MCTSVQVFVKEMKNNMKLIVIQMLQMKEKTSSSIYQNVVLNERKKEI